MQWVEAAILTKPEAIEALCGALDSLGITGVQIEDDAEFSRFLTDNPMQWDYVEDGLIKENTDALVRFYIPADESSTELLKILREKLTWLKSEDFGLDFGKLLLTVENVSDDLWTENWKKYYKPFRVGEKFVIRPEWEEYESSEGNIVLTVDPGHLFGTGLHQSTKMCLMSLENYIRHGMKVADIGCGSGILAIGAVLLGADSVFCCDIEATAAEVIHRNAALNGIPAECLRFKSGSVLTDEILQAEVVSGNFDVILINIVADVIIAALPLCKSGIVITSGIIREREGDVSAALSANSYDIIHTERMDEWVSITAQRGDEK